MPKITAEMRSNWSNTFSRTLAEQMAAALRDGGPVDWPYAWLNPNNGKHIYLCNLETGRYVLRRWPKRSPYAWACELVRSKNREWAERQEKRDAAKS